MISPMNEPFIKERILKVLTPTFKDWFLGKFKDFTEPQTYSIPTIHQRENILVSSPTGTGKTLSAFGAIVNELVDLDEKDLLQDKIYAVYVNPLKSLSRDIEVNLNQPLEELNEISKKKLGIRVGTRTGDTSPKEKAQLLKKPPHILITTPESLAIMLQSPRMRENFKEVDWFICDEIHALAENKRGVHLSLTMEMLQALSPAMCRIGLSATVAPLQDVAQFLVGSNRDCKLVDISAIKKMDLKVLSPVPNLIDTTYEELQKESYKLIDKLIQEHKTTLIFTNTRAATERVVHHLREKFPDRYSDLTNLEETPENITAVGAHHGSLSKDQRFLVEQGLRDGKVKCVVCSTSLELGIDIGYIDLVILLGSPKSVARALQRVGRAGHNINELTKGRIIVQDRDDLVECSVLLKQGIDKKIDRIHIPQNCLDVLSQQIYGAVLSEPISYSNLFKMVKRSYCYKNLSGEDFDNVLEYLTGDHVSLEDSHVYAKVWFDKETGMIGRKGRLARVIYMTNIGTIPDSTGIAVKIGENIIGTLDESFLERLKPRDIFVLGGSTYQFKFARGMTAQVMPVSGKRPTVPSWFSEMLPLSFDLAREIGNLRYKLSQKIDTQTKKEVLDWLHEYLYVDDNAAKAIYQYHKEMMSYVGLPHNHRLIVEKYKDDQKYYAIFHSLNGRRVNDVLSRSLAFALGRLQKIDIEVGISDNGFYLASKKEPQIQRALSALDADRLRELMDLAIERSNVLARRFRHCAGRSLMILRNYKGRRKLAGRQQVSAQILLSAVKRINNDFCILKEARREVLEDLMDIEHAKQILKEWKQPRVKVDEINTSIPSPFAFNLIMQGYADILRMEDRIEFLKRMHQQVLAKISLDAARKGKDPEIEPLKNEPRDYQEIWNEQSKSKIEKEVDEQEQLRLDLAKAARKTGMPANFIYDANRLIDGDTEGFRREFIVYLEELLSGGIPSIWTDGLVKLFREQLPKIK